MTRNRALLDWYDRHGRDLPWRHTDDPWAILVSEAMLQQTQVSRVVPVYTAFLHRYPDPSSLAAAPMSEAIRAWGELGFLRRVIRLHAAARVIADHGWPSDLRELPGVGRYTAAAVSVFALGQPQAAIDVNGRRILSRWAGRPLTQREAESFGAEAVERERPADWNEAMMDLGATVCIARLPRCEVCPVAEWCADPAVQIPRRPQSPFEGSVRQARATVLKTLAAGAMPDDPSFVTGLDPATVTAAVNALVDEGVIARADGELRLG
ncbi:MAG TPA: A/G-specific adenine glycosylase [Acidimicrobiia bacterium]|nr:A/G-specific adenine glycosylase [Acidimicrobiia bacterium]